MLDTDAFGATSSTLDLATVVLAWRCPFFSVRGPLKSTSTASQVVMCLWSGRGHLQKCFLVSCRRSRRVAAPVSHSVAMSCIMPLSSSRSICLRSLLLQAVRHRLLPIRHLKRVAKSSCDPLVSHSHMASITFRPHVEQYLTFHHGILVHQRIPRPPSLIHRLLVHPAPARLILRPSPRITTARVRLQRKLLPRLASLRARGEQFHLVVLVRPVANGVERALPVRV